MGLSAFNVFSVAIGAIAIVYSLVKATHERQYWRERKGYYVHVTSDVVWYFITGSFILIYGVYHILRDYVDDQRNKVEQQQQQPEIRTIELQHITSNQPNQFLNNNLVQQESSC